MDKRSNNRNYKTAYIPPNFTTSIPGEHKSTDPTGVDWGLIRTRRSGNERQKARI